MTSATEDNDWIYTTHFSDTDIKYDQVIVLGDDCDDAAKTATAASSTDASLGEYERLNASTLHLQSRGLKSHVLFFCCCCKNYSFINFYVSEHF